MRSVMPPTTPKRLLASASSATITKPISGPAIHD
jgi:hypothetical protein